MSEVDLLNCENEPIHIPGAIQPHGYLLALREADLSVMQASANVADLLDRPLEEVLERPLSEVFDASFAEQVKAAATGSGAPTTANALDLDVQVHGKTCCASVHRHEGVVVVELEHPSSEHAGQGTLAGAVRQLQAAKNLTQLMDTAVQVVRGLTGFDRVMLYRFEEDEHGQVLAEARREALDSFLGLHYPASDVPRQARALYLLNPLRLIPRSQYDPVPLVPALRPDTGRPLDLSFSLLRSVSPIHREYLQNMGLHASMSISLVVEEKLWGLISCGHEQPKPVSLSLRHACETIGGLLSLQIGALIELETRALRKAKAQIVEALADAMRNAPEDVLAGLSQRPAELTALVAATGVAIILDQDVMTVGECPTRAQLETLVEWLTPRVAHTRLYHTFELATEFSSAEAYREVASGLLAIALPKPQRNLVLWFRPERVQTVNWGGDPNKAVQTKAGESGMRLHPRRSFELWKETVVGQAARWQPGEIEATRDLRRYAIELDLHRQVLRERAAVQARDDLVAVVSHDLRSPIQTIMLQAMILKRSFGDITDESSRRLNHGIDRIQAVAQRMTILLNDLLDLSKIEAGRFALRRRPEDVGLLIEEACGLLGPLAESKSITLLYSREASLYADVDAERLFQVLSNVIGNAIKFTPENGQIIIAAQPVAGFVQFEVRDNGIGIDAADIPNLFDRYWQSRRQDAKGTGLGLYIARGIVQAHGGKIWAKSALGQGSSFYFTIPSASPPDAH